MDGMPATAIASVGDRFESWRVGVYTYSTLAVFTWLSAKSP